MKSLQNVMLINAASSGATGLLLVILADFVAHLFGVPSTSIFIGVGIFLLAFSGLVFYESRQIPLQSGRIRFIIMLDSVWVIASIILVLLPTINMSVLGRVLVVAVALWVALMAYLQAKNLQNT